MKETELKARIAAIKAMKPLPGGRLAARLSSLQCKLSALDIDMIKLINED